MSNPFEPHAPEDMFAPKGRTPTPQTHDPFEDADHSGYQAFAQQYAAANPAAARKKPVSGHSRMMMRLGALVVVVGAGAVGLVGYRHLNGDPLFQDREPTLLEVASTKAAMASLSGAKPEKTMTILQPPLEPVETARAATSEPDPVHEPAAPAPAPPQQVAALTEELPPSRPQIVEAPRPPAPAAPKLTQSELALLMERGHRFMESGDFASARPLYRRAAEAGYAEAALSLGDTYDPTFLRQRGVVGLAPDPEKARQWYQRALELGSLEADMKLGRLSQ